MFRFYGELKFMVVQSVMKVHSPCQIAKFLCSRHLSRISDSQFYNKFLTKQVCMPCACIVHVGCQDDIQYPLQLAFGSRFSAANGVDGCLQFDDCNPHQRLTPPVVPGVLRVHGCRQTTSAQPRQWWKGSSYLFTFSDYFAHICNCTFVHQLHPCCQIHNCFCLIWSICTHLCLH